MAWLFSQVSPAWTTRYLGVALGPIFLLASLGLARAGNLGLVALVIILAIWAIPKTSNLENKSNAADLATAVSDKMRPGDLVVTLQPEQHPLIHYHLRNDMIEATQLGEVQTKGVMDWRDVQDELEAATPAKNLEPLLDRVPVGGTRAARAPRDFEHRRLGRAVDSAGPAQIGAVGPGPGARQALRAGGRGTHVLPACQTHRGARSPLHKDLRPEELSDMPNTTSELATPGLKDTPTLIIGAGPAGLTAGYLLAKQGLPVIVFEAEDQVGGIAKTEVRDGPGGEYRFDLGGHRFFTKVKEVDDLWHEIMREEFLKRPRMSRIYWNKKFLDYPLRGPDVIKKLGPVELTRAFLSYLWAQVKPKGREDTFEQWVSNRFGKRLFNLFFKSYTEKVWGVPTSEIRAEWAAQRIKGLSFFSAAKAAFFGNKGNSQDAHRRVPLPALRPGPDVGADDQGHRGAGRPGAAQHARRAARDRGRQRSRSSSRPARSTSPTT